ncbi:hypothetical protein [Pseudonocardia sp. HH130629-09]|nr:hypothetical protein [Pseudonocardia sp. HH130629-09]
MEIDTDDLSGAEVQGFLAAHVADMHAQGRRRACTPWTSTRSAGRV